jgi:hypothetical protein
MIPTGETDMHPPIAKPKTESLAIQEGAPSMTDPRDAGGAIIALASMGVPANEVGGGLVKDFSVLAIAEGALSLMWDGAALSDRPHEAMSIIGWAIREKGGLTEDEAAGIRNAFASHRIWIGSVPLAMIATPRDSKAEMAVSTALGHPLGDENGPVTLFPDDMIVRFSGNAPLPVGLVFDGTVDISGAAYALKTIPEGWRVKYLDLGTWPERMPERLIVSEAIAVKKAGWDVPPIPPGVRIGRMEALDCEWVIPVGRRQWRAERELAELHQTVSDLSRRVDELEGRM